MTPATTEGARRRVLYLDPYHGPSHAALSTALRDHSRHEVTLLTLPPRKWKWRMRGAALAFEPAVRALPHPPDILVTTDMLNVPEFLALHRDILPPHLKVITYFHENQITYPLPRRDERDFHFGLANIYSALASDRVVFNSRFHRDDFLAAIPGVIDLMPDHRPEDPAGRIRDRSEVIGVPVERGAAPPDDAPRPPCIVWNHRWEEDKDPETFFRALEEIDARGIPFRLMMLGQSFREQPACFDEARRRLAPRIDQWGYLPDREAYLAALGRARVVVSTASHDYFGLAVREAIAAGCYPLLPRRVVYPEMVEGRDEHLYDAPEDLVARLARVLTDPPPPVDQGLRRRCAGEGPAGIAGRFDALIDALFDAPGAAPPDPGAGYVRMKPFPR